MKIGGRKFAGVKRFVKKNVLLENFLVIKLIDTGYKKIIVN